ncbi:FadR/GntR family transcriptional regulator [Corynebacterium confusum]|uniref:FadR/GntR family transcriptional regulator n=1 Tax=Corynebacterium confusum TaxID=71254 RepID=UPI0025B376F1|nr:FCD domain-containing protein [Corynebacterium confusum]WJY90392.1 transcriptional regulator NanR [Corynebacterium confusum]
MLAPTSQHPTPLLSSVLNQLGSEIVHGTIATGQTFTLLDICARFDISRTVAREAMRALEQLGLVASSRRVGITVLPMTEWVVYDQAVINWRLQSERTRSDQLGSLNELRLAIEPIAARLAAQRASAEECAELLALAIRLSELETSPSSRVGEELSTDLRFHTMILHASGNEMFAALAPSLLSIFKGKSVFGSPKRDPVAGTTRLHHELAAAIRDRDPDRAEHLSRIILDENWSSPHRDW